MKLILFCLALSLPGACNLRPHSEEDFTFLHFSHQGHDYIYIKSPSYGSTIFHDPDCELKDLKR